MNWASLCLRNVPNVSSSRLPGVIQVAPKTKTETNKKGNKKEIRIWKFTIHKIFNYVLLLGINYSQNQLLDLKEHDKREGFIIITFF